MTAAAGSSRFSHAPTRAALHLLVALGLTVVLLGLRGSGLVPPVLAAKPKLATSVILEAPTDTTLGKDVTVVGILRDGLGRPVPSERLTLYANGTAIRSARTDAGGKATFAIRSKELNTAGTYALRVVFAGSSSFAASERNGSMTVLPAAIQISTVPPVAGIVFKLGTVTASTGADGVAALPIPKPGSYPLTVDLLGPSRLDPAVRASFVRWLDEVYTADRTIDVKGPDTYQMGVTLAYRATVRYVDLNDQPVDPSIVEQATFSTGLGTNDVVLDGQLGVKDIWWNTATAVRRASGLAVSPITYRLLSARIHGADVVYRGQQAWAPTENGVWTIKLLLYALSVRTSDAFFGTPVRGTVQLIYPDGATIDQKVGSSGVVSFGTLPRGAYKLKLLGGSISPPSPIALSRPQTAVLRVLTYLDIAAVAGTLVLVLLLLLVIGRWSWVKSHVLRRPVRQPAIDRPDGGPRLASPGEGPVAGGRTAQASRAEGYAAQAPAAETFSSDRAPLEPDPSPLRSLRGRRAERGHALALRRSREAGDPLDRP